MPWLRRVRRGFLAIGGGLSRLRVHPIADELMPARKGDWTSGCVLPASYTIRCYKPSRLRSSRCRSLATFLSKRPEEAAQNLDHAIRLAADGIAEGRAAIQGLRCQAADQGDLEKMLSVAGQEWARCEEAREHPVRFRVLVEGHRQQLKPPVQEVVYQIARELLRNAFRHARASQVEARSGTSGAFLACMSATTEWASTPKFSRQAGVMATGAWRAFANGPKESAPGWISGARGAWAQR